MSEQGEEIRSFIVAGVRRHPSAIVALAAEKFQISRQGVFYHITRLIEEGILEAEGETSARIYSLKPIESAYVVLPLTDSLEEDRVWEEHIVPKFAASPTVTELCAYGFTEMFNNAIDHSEGSCIAVTFVRTAADVAFWIDDDGKGIFNKIAAAMNLSDPRQSLLELSKGKFTTDPDHHTGEGIFFTSRAFERFAILSENLSFLHRRDEDDWLLQHKGKDGKGTCVMLQLDLNHTKTLVETFRQFSGGEAAQHGFTKTHVPLKLALVGNENLVSRSQAKRVLNRFTRFEEVLLDFAGVESIGHSFADEIFRVFAKQNPTIKLVAINTNDAVRQMIAHAKSNAEQSPKS